MFSFPSATNLRTRQTPGELPINSSPIPSLLRQRQKPRDEPHAPWADRSAGLHLFQELSTLGQQFTPTLLFREGCGRVLPMFPASTVGPRQLTYPQFSLI
jgi:hypothetical protein